MLCPGWTSAEAIGAVITSIRDIAVAIPIRLRIVRPHQLVDDTFLVCSTKVSPTEFTGNLEIAGEAVLRDSRHWLYIAFELENLGAPVRIELTTPDLPSGRARGEKTGL